MARSIIEIDDSPFVRSHMHSPRGYGSWAFSFESDPRDVCRDVVFTPAMLYRDAKVWIRAWVRRQQADGKVGAASHVTVYAQP